MVRRTIFTLAVVTIFFSITGSRITEAESVENFLYFPVIGRMNPWQEVGSGSASGCGISNTPGYSNWPVVAVAPDGTPYVTWVESMTDAPIYVRRYLGGFWEEVGLGSASGGGISLTDSADNPDIAIAPDGTPYITWEVYRGASGYEIYVRKFDGENWVEVGSGSASGGGISNNPGVSRRPSIAIAPDGKPYIAWDDSSSGNTEIYVLRWNGAQWEEIGPGSASGGGVSNNFGNSTDPSIAMDPNGSPYIAWDDTSGPPRIRIYARRWNGVSWEEIGEHSASGNGVSNDSNHAYRAEIAIASNGTPYIVWTSEAILSPVEHGFYIYIKRWIGGGWVEVGAGSASGGGLFGGAGLSTYPSLVVAADGIPYVAWGQQDELEETLGIYVLRWNGNHWEEAGFGSASAGGINMGSGFRPTIAASNESRIYAAWHDYCPVGLIEVYVRTYLK